MTGQEEQNEQALVCAAQKGEKEAFRMLLTQNWPWLKALVYSIIRNTDGMDDVMQDISVQVIRKVNTLREPSRSLNNDEVAGQQCDYKAGQLLENLEIKEQYQQILQAVKSLPQIYRDVFMLAHLEDLSYAKIAEILDVPVTTVQIRLVRARRMIFNQIKDSQRKEA
jgi:RNA polymerase sigma-70 factor (ECF subfamily)